MLKALRAQRPFLLASDTQRIVRMAQTDLFKGLQIKSPNFEAPPKPRESLIIRVFGVS